MGVLRCIIELLLRFIKLYCDFTIGVKKFILDFMGDSCNENLKGGTSFRFFTES